MIRIFNVAKKLLPKISETEMIALRSGTVSFDRNVMANTVNNFDFKSLLQLCRSAAATPVSCSYAV